jgi:hypothetical protein
VVSSTSAISVSPATALLLFRENLIASPWVELRALPSSGGAHGRTPLELGFWSEGGLSIATDGAQVLGGSEILHLFGKGNAVVRLEEKRKGFGGFILLGSKCSVWLKDVVEEVMGAQRKEDFTRSFQDEVRMLKVRMGSNQAGCFLEVAVFVEGGRKGVIRLPEGRGGWD